MKKHIRVMLIMFVLAIVVAIPLFLSGNRTYKGTNSLIEIVREVIPVSEADTIDISFAGLCGKDDKALLWFVSGNEYQSHYYLPMECTVVGADEYKYERIYKPIERGADIVALEWLRGYAFLINDPNCAAVHIEGEVGTCDENIEKDSYPYVFYYDGLPSDYRFLDADGNEIS